MQYSLHIKDISKKYKNSDFEIKDISIKVKYGSVVSILGPNGAGKTTLIKLLTGQLKPDSGRIMVLGKEPIKNRHELFSRIGILPQNFKTFGHLSVFETIQYYATMYGKSVNVNEILELVNLDKHSKTKVSDLSGGLNQKLGIAIALIPEPELVFLDEPSTGLDPTARRDIWKLIKGLKEKKITVILTTHYLEEAEVLSDRVIIIMDGKISTDGTVSELISKYGGKRKIRVFGEVNPNIFNDFSVKQNEDTIEIFTDDIIAVINLITKNNIDISKLEIQNPNLEDVFLNLTGYYIKNGEVKAA